jgi:hypothetical protein
MIFIPPEKSPRLFSHYVEKHVYFNLFTVIEKYPPVFIGKENDRY